MIMSSGNNSNNFFKCFLYDKQKKFELFEAKKKSYHEYTQSRYSKTLEIDLVESTIKIQLITFINSNGNIKVNLHFSAASYLIKS